MCELFEGIILTFSRVVVAGANTTPSLPLPTHYTNTTAGVVTQPRDGPLLRHPAQRQVRAERPGPRWIRGLYAVDRLVCSVQCVPWCVVCSVYCSATNTSWMAWSVCGYQLLVCSVYVVCTIVVIVDALSDKNVVCVNYEQLCDWSLQMC